MIRNLAEADRVSQNAADTGRRFRTERTNGMELGAFSISLAVKDLEASRRFYEKVAVDPDGNPILVDQHV